MRDAIEMWKSTKMVVLVALTAGVYAAVLIPFKPIPLVPGITEIRPGNVVPIVCSLLFGPAAAWGAAIGNLIGDFFGTLGPGSLFGLVGNFLYGYLPYRLWRLMARGRPATGRPADLPWVVVAIVVASCACSVTICFGVDFVFGIAPYAVVGPMIALNNALVAGALTPVLLPLLYGRVRAWGLLADEIMPERHLAPGPLVGPGAVLVALGACAGLAIVWLPLPEGLHPAVGPGVCVVLVLVGSALLARPARLGRSAAEPGPVVVSGAAEGLGIEFQDVSFTYRGANRPALQGLSLTQNAGTVRVVMGRTAAGKTTLCRCLNGLIPQHQRGDFRGVVRVAGRAVSDKPVAQSAERVGIVFQDFESQLFSSDVRAEVAFALESFATDRAAMGARVDEALARVRLSRYERRDPATLSGGEKQRLAIASVLAARPPILVLDEPTTDLDPRGKAELFALARSLHDEGLTLLITEHETEHALEADRLTVLDEGRLAYDGPPAELLADPDGTVGLGIHPLEMPELCALLGRPERPLTVSEAAEVLSRQGYRLNDDAVNALREREAERAARYGEVVVSTRDLTHTYGETEALRGVTLSIRQGEFVAIVGQNGCGKTTLAKHFDGLLKPTSGEVAVRSLDTRTTPVAELAKIVGYVFQDPDHQIFSDRADAEVAFGPRNLGVPEPEIASRVVEALGQVGLTGKEAADPFSLTKGERQRLATASILAGRPDLIILDEPTTGLDGEQQQAIMGLLTALNEQGHTIVVITHAMWAAARYAHRVLLLRDGQIAADGPAREVFRDLKMLEDNALRPPDSVRLSVEHLGVCLLSPEELATCLTREC